MYYEKWVGRHASFPPRRSVKQNSNDITLSKYKIFVINNKYLYNPFGLYASGQKKRNPNLY